MCVSFSFKSPSTDRISKTIWSDEGLSSLLHPSDNTWVSYHHTKNTSTSCLSFCVASLRAVAYERALRDSLWNNKHSRDKKDNNVREKPRVETDVGGLSTVGCTMRLFPKQWNMTTCVYPRLLSLSLSLSLCTHTYIFGCFSMAPLQFPDQV